ncbi:hypothetical protein [Falsirhodobacter algicola]|uniref:Imelysin-like domain-containing protein n=1 Tax=Falsirhodobacter algicola TaxID=2692330 RepID=A0A8J8SKC9_9RHOB|nr:hypothetical protein [Falsirhodobacter algicola]QUS35279.1 hypothetical protein GR316_02710 [Falsirhodobacter algicola]
MIRRAILSSALLAALMPLAAAAQDEADALTAIYDTVLQADAAGTVESCHALSATLEAGGTADERAAGFEALAMGWGRVEAAYVLGSFDMDAMDYPLLIDMFHHGKEDLHASLGRAIDSESDPAKALYKNAYRSMTALDDLLFSGPWSDRRAALAQYATQSLCSRFETVEEGYAEHRDDFLSDPDEAVGLLMNAQIQNLYKTRDWRLAEVAGLTKKTLGRAHPENRQFPWGDASWPTIGAILDTHLRLLGAEGEPNLATIAKARGAGTGLAEVQDGLAEAVRLYEAVPQDAWFDPRASVPIINALRQAQNSYYDSLALLVGVSLGLVDADGD